MRDRLRGRRWRPNFAISIRISQDHPEHIGAPGSECHADADFIRPSGVGNDVGHDPINPNAGEKDGEQSEEGGELGDETLVGDGAADLFVERSYISDGQAVINRADGLLHGSGNGAEVARVADFEIAEAPGALCVRKVVEMYWFFGKLVKFSILRYPDDGDIVFRFIVAYAVMTPDRVADGETASSPCAR